MTPPEVQYVQLEQFLLAQLEKCTHYKSVFETQDNSTLASKFETLYNVTVNDLDIVRKTWQTEQQLPGYAFEKVFMTCLPTNLDVKEKELEISVKVSSLPVASNAHIYAIGEFEFPITGKEESFSDFWGRWTHTMKIEPMRALKRYAGGKTHQLDLIHCTDIKPFHKQASKLTYFDRALKFFIDKGKPLTLRRRFKPIKLTFYEKNNLFKLDRKLGSVQIKIDGINDFATFVKRLPIILGRRQLDAFAEIKVRVREPLVDKSLKNHRERLLVLT